MKRWNGIEMGFRKRDEEAQRRRQQRANEISLKYASRKNGTVQIVMSDELHNFKESVKYCCATCLELGLDTEECPLFVMSDEDDDDMGDFIHSEEWQKYPVLYLQCEAGHFGQMLLNEILIVGKYPVYLEFANLGISWLEDGFFMGDVQKLIDTGRWPVNEEE